MPVFESCRQEVRNILERCRPSTLLAMGELAQSLARDYARERDFAGLTEVALTATARLAALGRQDLALVTDLDALPHAEAGILLARLRDLHAERVLVLLPRSAEPARWSHRDMIGHGFSVVGDFGDDGETCKLYGFDLTTYKTTPDWLNSKHWAHPELWGKHRW